MKNNMEKVITKEMIIDKIMKLNKLSISDPEYNVILDIDYEWSQHKKLSIGEIQVTETTTTASNYVSIIYRLYIMGDTPQGISHDEIKELWGVLSKLHSDNRGKSKIEKIYDYLNN